MFATLLIHRGWLVRGIEVSLPDGVHVVEYNGKGFGYEQVSVDGRVTRKTCWYWFVPRFDFDLAGYRCAIEVRVWPWLCLGSLVLWVGDEAVYAEGIGARGWDEIQAPVAWKSDTTCRVRKGLTVRALMTVVAIAALPVFIPDPVFVGHVTQCYGGRTMPVEFAILDAKTGSPVPQASITLSGRGKMHTIATGPDGRGQLIFQPGCEERIHVLSGSVCTVHYSNWHLEIEAEGYEIVQENLSNFREDTTYPVNAVPPPMFIKLKRHQAMQ